jgi:uncharacterized damage-inducible protein DinB
MLASVVAGEEQLKDSLMQLDAIRELYDYNHWANQRVLSSVTPLTDEVFTRNMGNSFSSVRDTLAHILGAEWIWLERWLGRSPEALLRASDFPTLRVLQQRWATVRHDQNQYIQTLVPDRLKDEVSYTNTRGDRYSYALWRQMVHVPNHSSYHRGQITTLLRQIGAEPASTDLLVYYDHAA